VDNFLSEIPEDKLRQLAVDLARDIRPADAILRELDISSSQYEDIKHTRAFRAMFDAASIEWNAAGNTPKRAKLKAAMMTEEVLPLFMDDIRERKESLTARVALLNTLAKIGGLGQPEPITNAGSGQFFKLEIHLQGKASPIVIDGESISEPTLRESSLLASEPFDEF
jgi:hypothetical protein